MLGDGGVDLGVVSPSTRLEWVFVIDLGVVSPSTRQEWALGSSSPKNPSGLVLLGSSRPGMDLIQNFLGGVRSSDNSNSIALRGLSLKSQLI